MGARPRARHQNSTSRNRPLYLLPIMGFIRRPSAAHNQISPNINTTSSVNQMWKPTHRMGQVLANQNRANISANQNARRESEPVASLQGLGTGVPMGGYNLPSYNQISAGGYEMPAPLPPSYNESVNPTVESPPSYHQIANQSNVQQTENGQN